MTNKLWTIKSRKRFFLIERIKKILSKNKKAEEENLARLEKIALSAKAEQATRRPKGNPVQEPNNQNPQV